jgi:hypothetical protein
MKAKEKDTIAMQLACDYYIFIFDYFLLGVKGKDNQGI